MMIAFMMNYYLHQRELEKSSGDYLMIKLTKSYTKETLQI